LQFWMTDALDVAGRVRLHWVPSWYHLERQPQLLVGLHFVINSGLWPSNAVLAGNVTRVTGCEQT
jgi:hypothetical protein